MAKMQMRNECQRNVAAMVLNTRVEEVAPNTGGYVAAVASPEMSPERD